MTYQPKITFGEMCHVRDVLPPCSPCEWSATNDYSVFEDKRRIGRIRFASERTPPIWLWNHQIHIHLTGGLPMGSSLSDLDTAKTEFKAAWLAFREKHGRKSWRRPTSR